MPEGPELHLSSLFVKKVGEAREFVAPIIERQPASRPNRLVEFGARLGAKAMFTLTAWSRGKEMMVALKPLNAGDDYQRDEWTIRFNFGMSGSFKFTKTSEVPKHAKVCFTCVGEPAYTLSFVDPRAFGRWTVTSKWSDNRGPCILQEPDLFRSHVLQSLEKSVFNKPICEAMLDQRYFNGVGNYLRAEALFRLAVPPFSCARDVLSSLTDDAVSGEGDLLRMCSQLASEVVGLGGGRLVGGRYNIQLQNLEGLIRVGAPDRDAAPVKEEALELKRECEEDNAAGGINFHPGGMMDITDGQTKPVKSECDVQMDEENAAKLEKFEDDEDPFDKWLRCYYQPEMKNLVDHNGRTIWFSGPTGPLVPKSGKTRHAGSPKKSTSAGNGTKAKREKMQRDNVRVRRQIGTKSAEKDTPASAGKRPSKGRATGKISRGRKSGQPGSAGSQSPCSENSAEASDKVPTTPRQSRAAVRRSRRLPSALVQK